MSFFDLPMSANPRDPVVGIDELGRPVRRSVLGAQYGEAYAQPQPGLLAPMQGPRQDMARGDRSRRRDEPGNPPDFGGVARGLLDAAVQGFTAPGRALQGEPVTMGDVWATALDYGVMGAPMRAPEGALRAGGMRNPIFQKADDAAAEIKRRYGVNAEVSKHPTSYGNSSYVHARIHSDDGLAYADRGFRLSDHEVGEFRRGTDPYPTIIDGQDITVDSLMNSAFHNLDAEIAKLNSGAAARAKKIAAKDAWSSLPMREKSKLIKKARKLNLPGGAEENAEKIFVKSYNQPIDVSAADVEGAMAQDQPQGLLQ